jgi:drug/metabolite transporter (DMT)-like permease
MLEMSLTFVIWLKALNTSENTAKVSNLIYLSPFIGLFFIRLTVGEPIHISTIVGLAIIIAGILIQQFPVKKGKLKIE